MDFREFGCEGLRLLSPCGTLETERLEIQHLQGAQYTVLERSFLTHIQDPSIVKQPDGRCETSKHPECATLIWGFQNQGPFGG